MELFSFASFFVVVIELYEFFVHFSPYSEKVMAPQSSTLAWKIPWTEEPGRLQSMRSQRIGHDWATELNWSEVAQPCPTLCNPMDCSLPGSSIHGIFQARVLEWVAISCSRGSSWPRDRTQVSHIVGRHFTVWATREAPK